MPSQIVNQHLSFTFEVEEEGGFCHVPEVGYGNFLWPAISPPRQPLAELEGMGHAPAEAALGKEALNQLVFDNAVKLYKIPVRLPQ